VCRASGLAEGGGGGGASLGGSCRLWRDHLEEIELWTGQRLNERRSKVAKRPGVPGDGDHELLEKVSKEGGAGGITREDCHWQEWWLRASTRFCASLRLPVLPCPSGYENCKRGTEPERRSACEAVRVLKPRQGSPKCTILAIAKGLCSTCSTCSTSLLLGQTHRGVSDTRGLSFDVLSMASRHHFDDLSSQRQERCMIKYAGALALPE
jgi:hypothetical protein